MAWCKVDQKLGYVIVGLVGSSQESGFVGGCLPSRFQGSYWELGATETFLNHGSRPTLGGAGSWGPWVLLELGVLPGTIGTFFVLFL